MKHSPDSMPVHGLASSGNGLMVAAVYGKVAERDLHQYVQHMHSS